MKTTENINLTTAGQMLGGLKKYEKKHWDLSVVAWTQDDLTLGVVGMGKDGDGDLRVEVEEVDDVLEGIWIVSDVIDSLERIGKDTRVYMAGHGLYFSIDSEGGIFTESDDDDVVGCYATVFGEYEEEPQGWQTEEEKRKLAKEALKEARGERWMHYILWAMVLGALIWLIYTIYALIAGVGGPLWERILSLVTCVIILFVGCGTLYYSKR